MPATLPAAGLDGGWFGWEADVRRKHMPRRLVKFTFIGAVLMLVLTACGGPDEGGGSGGGGGGAQGTGPITFVAGKDTSGKYPAVIKKWNAAHADQQVKLLELPEAADAQRSAFVTNLQAKSDTYDVMGIDVIWTAEFAKSGWLLALDESQFPVNEMLKPAVDTGRFEGKLWAVPYDTNGGLLFYRKDILDKASKEAPKTFDELKADCSLAQQNNMDCYGGQFAKYEGLTVNFAEAVQAAGGELMTDNGTKAALGAPAVQGLTFLADGFKNGTMPKPAITYKEEESRRAFMSGKLLFLRNWPYVYGKAAETDPSNKVKGKVGIAPLPGFTGPGSSSLGGLNFAISAFSKKQATAVEFVKFATNQENAKEMVGLTGNAPAWPDLYNDSDLVKKFPFLPTLKQGMDTAKPRPVTPYYQEVTTAIQEDAYAALQGQKTPDQAINDLTQKLNEIGAQG
jgi:multiple sugar transport system substrate-binding protein